MKIYVTDGIGDTDVYDCDIIDEDVAEELANDYVSQGEYGQGPVDVHVCTRRFSRQDGDILREWDVKVVVDPEIPDCGASRYDSSTESYHNDRDHDWQSPQWLGGLKENPGVWGSNHGGVRCREVCSRCGMYRITDTGDTDHTGQRYTSVIYEDADDQSLQWIEE